MIEYAEILKVKRKPPEGGFKINFAFHTPELKGG